MDRGIKIPNKILDSLWNYQSHNIHLRKLKNMKSVLKFKEPDGPFNHLYERKKKEQLAEDRYTEIERANRILLEKMTRIMNDGTPFTRSMRNRSVTELRTRSLNLGKRKGELKKISIENHAMLKRLQSGHSEYSQKSMRMENNKRYVENLCEYPYILNEKISCRRGSNFKGRKSHNLSFDSQRSHIMKHKRGMLKEAYFDRLQKEKKQPFYQYINHKKNFKRLVFKGAKTVAGVAHFIEIWSDIHKLTIIAKNMYSSASFVVSIPQERAEEVMKLFKYDYDLMASSLNIQNGKLTVINPSALNNSNTH